VGDVVGASVEGNIFATPELAAAFAEKTIVSETWVIIEGHSGQKAVE